MLELNTILQMVTYIFTIVLLVVCIIIGIKLIQLENKAEKILDDVDKKMSSMNGLFQVITKTSSTIDLISSKIVNKIMELIGNLLKKKKEDEDSYE